MSTWEQNKLQSLSVNWIMTMVLDRKQNVISIILLLDDDYLESDEGWWGVQLSKNHER